MLLHLCSGDDDLVIPDPLLRETQNEPLNPSHRAQSYQWAVIAWSMTQELAVVGAADTSMGMSPAVHGQVHVHRPVSQ